MNGQFHYASIDDILKDNGVTSFKETDDGLIAIHKRNSEGGYYWKYYRFEAQQIAPYDKKTMGYVKGYYYTGSTSKFER